MFLFVYFWFHWQFLSLCLFYLGAWGANPGRVGRRVEGEGVVTIALAKSLTGFLLLIFGFMTNILKRDDTVVTSTIRSLSSFIASMVILLFVGVSSGPGSRNRSCKRKGCRALTAAVVKVILVYMKTNLF